jgi:tetratricopeptide (TPR) repeat protein
MALDVDLIGHLADWELERFTADVLNCGLHEALVYLHVTECRRCAARLARLARRPLTGGADGTGGDGEAPRLAEGAHTFALARAKARFDAVCSDETGDPLEVLLRDPRNRRWRTETHLARAAELRETDIRGAEDLARMAVHDALAIPDVALGPGVVYDLRARAWGELANYRRIANNQIGAEHALQESLECLEKGSRAPLLLARHLDIAGSFLREQRRFEEAITALEDAHDLYLEQGERHLAGRVLVTLSAVYAQMDENDEAMTALWQALQLIDRRRDRPLVLGVIRNLFLTLINAGHGAEVAATLWQWRPAFARHASPLEQTRLLWTEARLWRTERSWLRAEKLYRQVIATFTAEDLAYDAALASLELGQILLAQKRRRELLRLLDGAVRSFAERHIHRELVMAVAVVRSAAASGDCTETLLDLLAERIKGFGDLPRPAGR